LRLLRVIHRTAAGVPTAVLLSALMLTGLPAAGAAGAVLPPGEAAELPPGPAAAASCRIEPAVLDVGSHAGPLTVRLELPQPSGHPISFAALGAAIAPGVYVAAVNGVRLPAPSPGREGIGERVASRTVEDRADPASCLMTPNGVPEMVVRFDRPADGSAVTREDGDAGDIIAMLMDVPDGRQVEICIAGRTGEGAFECCDAIEVRNRGLRDLPRGLSLSSSF